jgi:hypothetical protein
MEYVEDEVCNKTGIQDLVNCSIEYQQLFNVSRGGLRPEAVAVPFTFALIFLFGLIGNALLILNFARHKTLSTAHNALVVNLAIGDLLMLLVGVPYNSVLYTLPYWPFGDVICRLSRFAETLTTCVTIVTLTVLSVERLCIVTGRRRHLATAAASAPRWLLIAIWVVACVVALPDLIASTVIKLPISNQHATICVDQNPDFGPKYSKAVVMSKFVVLFLLPLLIIAPCYIALAIHLFFRMFSSRPKSVATYNNSPSCRTPLRPSATITYSNNDGENATDENHDPTQADQNKLSAPTVSDTSSREQSYASNKSSVTASSVAGGLGKGGDSGQQAVGSAARKQRRLAVTVLGLVGVFIVCWLPRHVFLLWFHFDPSPYNTFWHIFKITAFCLLFANSALNPYVFYVLDVRFRAFMHSVVCCRRAPCSGGPEVGGRGVNADTTAAVGDTTAMVSVDVDRNTHIALAELPAPGERLDAV